MKFENFMNRRETELSAAKSALNYLFYSGLDVMDMTVQDVLKNIPEAKIPEGTNPVRFAAIVLHLAKYK